MPNKSKFPSRIHCLNGSLKKWHIAINDGMQVGAVSSNEYANTCLMLDHDKLMHMFLVQTPDLSVFAHIHLVQDGYDSFSVQLPPLPTGGAASTWMSCSRTASR